MLQGKEKIIVRVDEGCFGISENVLTEINKYADSSSERLRCFRGHRTVYKDAVQITVSTSLDEFIKALCYSIDQSYEQECIRND